MNRKQHVGIFFVVAGPFERVLSVVKCCFLYCRHGVFKSQSRRFPTLQFKPVRLVFCFDLQKWRFKCYIIYGVVLSLFYSLFTESHVRVWGGGGEGVISIALIVRLAYQLLISYTFLCPLFVTKFSGISRDVKRTWRLFRPL